MLFRSMFTQPIAYGPELVPAYTWDPSYVLMDGVQGHPAGVHQTSYPARPNYTVSKNVVPSSKASRSTKHASSTVKGSSSTVDTMPTSANNHPSSKFANKVHTNCCRTEHNAFERKVGNLFLYACFYARHLVPP